MATPPGPWSWVPPDWLGGGDVLPAPEMQFPPDDFADLRSVQPELEMPEEYVGAPPQPDVDPFAALRAPSAEQPYMGLPTDLDAAPPVEPEPLPQEDAITGVGPIPAAPMVGGLGIPEDMFQAAMAPVPTTTPGVPVLPPEYVSDQEAGLAYAMSSPEQQLNQQLDLEQRRSDMQRQRMAEASKADAEEAERDERDWRTSREAARREIEQVDIEAKAEAAREIDINRGWNDASTGTKIAGIFSALAGGLVAHKYGGRNSGLEMIDKLIDRDIDAQKFNKLQRTNDLTRRGASARDRLQMAGDDFREETRLRLTAYDRVLGQIASDAQNFDPRGTQAIRYGQAYQDLAAKRAQMAADAQKRIADQYKEQLDFAGKELDLQKKQADLAKAQRAAMGGGPGTGAKLSPDQWAAQYGEAGRPPRPMDDKEFKQWLANRGKLASATSAEAEAEKKRRENSDEWIAGELGAGDLTNEDGSPVLFRTSESAARIAKKRGAVENAVRLIDQLSAARAKYGWSSDLFKSDEWQGAQADMGALIIESKNDAELGALSGPDMGLIEKMLGTTDPTSVIDPTPGLKRYRQNSINSLNGVIRAEARPGSTPKRYDIKAPNYEKPTESEEDRVLARAQAETVGSFTTFVGDQKNVDPSKRKKLSRGEEDAAYKASGGIPPTLRAQIDRWESDARSGDEAASSKARAYLLKLTETGGSPEVRAAAETALTAANMADAEDGPRTSTVRDGVDIRGRK